ncbi:MAG TPA: hypothetical protein VFO40_03460 [Chthoniobacterales bacterium]|nr:hypothetical protein [Chthoniobacterales bacterium]
MAARPGQYATVEGVVAKVFTTKNGNTLLIIGAAHPNQIFTGWIPILRPSKTTVLDGIEGKHVKILGLCLTAFFGMHGLESQKHMRSTKPQPANR